VHQIVWDAPAFPVFPNNNAHDLGRLRPCGVKKLRQWLETSKNSCCIVAHAIHACAAYVWYFQSTFHLY
jgi:hypothetical protein